MIYEIKRSVSLYSYQEAYFTGKLDLEGCIRETAKAGATGVELLAEEMVDDFPVITPDFRARWFDWMSQYGTEPSCMDAFLENHIFDNRVCTLREQIANMRRDIEIAHTLGFKVLRTLVSTPMEVIEGSLKIAEDNDVKIGLEVHSPFSLNSGWSEGYMEMIRRTGTKYFGFIPDFGIFCQRIPTELTNQALARGAHPECVQLVQDAFRSRCEKGFVKIRYDKNLGAANMDYRMANGQGELMDAYKKAGYHGFLSTEWEGGEMIDDASEECVEQVRRHQECLRRCIED